MPVLVSSRQVTDLPGEYASQTIIVGCGDFLELLPRPACGERVGVRGGLGTLQFGRLA
jgi:hypothetical protein